MKVTNYLLTGMILQVWDGTLIHGTVVAKKGSSYERLSNKSFFYSCAINLWLRVSPKNIKGIKNDISYSKQNISPHKIVFLPGLPRQKQQWHQPRSPNYLEGMILWKIYLALICWDTRIQENYNTPVEHTPGNPPSQLWKESLYSLLVKV